MNTNISYLTILEQETVKEKLFPMYPHSIKSLGAWGGDFALWQWDIQAM